MVPKEVAKAKTKQEMPLQTDFILEPNWVHPDNSYNTGDDKLLVKSDLWLLLLYHEKLGHLLFLPKLKDCPAPWHSAWFYGNAGKKNMKESKKATPHGQVSSVDQL